MEENKIQDSVSKQLNEQEQQLQSKLNKLKLLKSLMAEFGIKPVTSAGIIVPNPKGTIKFKHPSGKTMIEFITEMLGRNPKGLNSEMIFQNVKNQFNPNVSKPHISSVLSTYFTRSKKGLYTKSK